MSFHQTYHHLTPTADAAKAAKKKKPSSARRINILMILFGIAALLLGAQLVRHQVFGIMPEQKAAEIPVKLRPRGAIVDTHGHPLAIQQFRYVIVASPNIMGPKTRKKAAKALDMIVGLSEQELLTLFAENDAPKTNITLNATPVNGTNNTYLLNYSYTPDTNGSYTLTAYIEDINGESAELARTLNIGRKEIIRINTTGISTVALIDTLSRTRLELEYFMNNII